MEAVLRIRDVCFLIQKLVSKLSEIWSGMFPDLDFFLPIRDSGVKKALNPGSGSAPLDGRMAAIVMFILETH